MKFLASAGSLVDDSIISWELEAEGPVEAERRAVQAARRMPAADTGNIWVEQIEDDFNLVLEKLEGVLQITKDLQEISTLIWDPEKKEVMASFYYDFDPVIIPIKSESAASMITEVIEGLMSK